MADLRLLSLDFDGTMIAPWEDGRAEPSRDLLRCLEHLRSAGVVFAMNTGRTLPLVEDAIRLFPFQPDYALTTEREVFAWSGKRWEPVGDWNHQCYEKHAELFGQAREQLSRIEQFVGTDTAARLVREDDQLVGLVAQSEAEMIRIVDVIAQAQKQLADLSYQRNGVYLRFCHRAYDKGAVLRNLQDFLGITAEQTFAAGDNHNDLPMLRPDLARYLACPSNSVPEIKSLVRLNRGIVAERKGGAGTAEALIRFFPGLLPG
jgi:HAD superfamily hydrolase (TIGR01484 family)